MPSKLINFSELSPHIREEPWEMHFWESTPNELQEFLFNPRAELETMGISLRPEIRIEVTIENLDWIADKTQNFSRMADASGDPIVICGTGGGGGSTAATAKDYYKVSFYGHLHSHLASGHNS